MLGGEEEGLFSLSPQELQENHEKKGAQDEEFIEDLIDKIIMQKIIRILYLQCS